MKFNTDYDCLWNNPLGKLFAFIAFGFLLLVFLWGVSLAIKVKSQVEGKPKQEAVK